MHIIQLNKNPILQKYLKVPVSKIALQMFKIHGCHTSVLCKVSILLSLRVRVQILPLGSVGQCQMLLLFFLDAALNITYLLT